MISGCNKKASSNEIEKVTSIPTSTSVPTEIPTPKDLSNKEENRINKEDIFIKNHPLLKNTPFYMTTIDKIKEKYPEKLDITNSEERVDGNFIYYKGDGIVYITREDGSLYSVILTNNNYEFGCGLKVGMDESDISNLGFSFKVYNSDEIGVDKKVSTYLLSCKIGPLSMFDFDTLYYYSATLDNGNEKDGFTGYCLGLMALMKDGKFIVIVS